MGMEEGSAESCVFKERISPEGLAQEEKDLSLNHVHILLLQN